MSQERERILNMLSKGEIEVEEADQLLKSLGAAEKKNVSSQKKINSLKIIVSEKGKEKVNISLPLGLAKGVYKLIPSSAKEKIKEEDIELDTLFDSIDNLKEPSDIVNINDGDDKVIIRLE